MTTARSASNVRSASRPGCLAASSPRAARPARSSGSLPTGSTASTCTRRCGCGSITTWSGAARPTSADQADRRAAAGSDRSPPAAAAGPEQWLGAPDIRRVAALNFLDALLQGHGLAGWPGGHVGEAEGVHDRAVLDREGGQPLDQVTLLGLKAGSGVVGD